jgi:hypothetical protein
VKHRLTFSAIPLTILVACLGCSVDHTGLGAAEMPVLPHDGAALPDSATGTAGGTGAGTAGTSGTAGDMAIGGNGGGAGDTAAGTAGTQGTAGDQGAAGMGTAGTGAGGDQGTAGAAGAQGAAGSTGTAGAQGTAGSMGTAGSAAGTGGAGGVTGTAGTTGGAGGGGAGGAPACGPKTCPNGCCDAGKCYTGRTVQRCGTGGGACSTCGGCLLCNSSGACDVDPSASWDIVCGSATVAQTQPNGMTWDPQHGGPNGPDPDPFCQFEMPTNTTNPLLGKSSPTIIDTFTPVWNYDVTPAAGSIKASDLMSTSKTWRLWVGDDDGCTARGCVGQEICEIDQPLPADALISGQLTRQNIGSCISLTVKFVCAQ